ncbi:MAG: ThiF family adenylyltransferase [Candidatus Berkelbacteria bacterium]
MNKLDKLSFHTEHHSRNMGLLTEEEQQKIDSKSLLIAGCGVGSMIALNAARLGFEKFVLVDGDVVELSNINRQAYLANDVGRFKVNALASLIKKINPHAEIKKYPIFVDIHNAKKLVHKADIIIDSIDPDAAQAVIAMHREAQKEHKSIIQPTDVGWGAMLQIFTPDSISYEKMIGLDPKTPVAEINNDEAFGKFIEFFTKIMPPYVQKIIMQMAEGKLLHYPQPASASYTLAVMTVMAAKRIACGEPVKVAPDYIEFDPDAILDPTK